MLTDAEIEALIASQPAKRSRKALIAGILKKVRCCPLCFELFRQKENLKEHLCTSHAEDLANSKRYEVRKHDVRENAREIYVCKFCGYAVCNGGLHSPVSRIMDHLETCPEYRKVIYTEHKSFRISTDADLIRAYVEGHAEIAMHGCSICNKNFATSKSLTLHVVRHHSGASSDNLSDEQRARIKDLIDPRLEERIGPASRDPIDIPAGTEEKPDAPQPPTATGPIRPHIARHQSATPPATSASPPAQHRPAPSASSTGDEFSGTLSQDEVNGGYCKAPPRLRSAIGLTDTVAASFRGREESALPYDSSQGRLLGLGSWYLGNAVEGGDKIYFRLLEASELRVELWTNWERSFDQLLRCPPENFDWLGLPIRDCLLRVLSESAEPLHYRSLYAKISKHRELAPGSILGVLSRYRGILFALTTRGTWELMHEEIRFAQEGGRAAVHRSPQKSRDREEEVWLSVAVAEIENHDLVYKLLQRTHQDMSFAEICRKIADHYGVDWQALSTTNFLDASDPRLKRLTNGNFALVEWFKAKTPQGGGSESGEPQPFPKPLAPVQTAPPVHDVSHEIGDNAPGKKRERIGRKAWSFLRRFLVLIISAITRKKD